MTSPCRTIRTMACLLSGLVGMSASSVSFAMHANAGALAEQSQYVCDSVSAGQAIDYETHFSAEFKKAVPKAALDSILAKVRRQYGPCQGWYFKQKRNDHSGRILTRQAKNKELRFSLAVDPSSSVITGLMALGEASRVPQFSSLEQAANAWQTLAKAHAPAEEPQPDTGNESANAIASLLISTGKKDLLAINPEAKHALGSAFKLWVLMALDEKIRHGELHWHTEVPIKEQYKSLPSGEMHKLPEGTLVSIKQLAQNMIRISDNTATDHLIRLLGRKNIEQFLLTHRLTRFDNQPLLTTRELFLIRATYSDIQAGRWQQSNRREREKMLTNLPALNRSALLLKLAYWRQPKHIQRIEWFASPREMCNSLLYFEQTASATAKAILALNTPLLPVEQAPLAYAGFKGGSEPGVLQLNYLLKPARGEPYCVVMGLNNTQKLIDENAAFGTAEGLLKVFLESIGNPDKSEKSSRAREQSKS